MGFGDKIADKFYGRSDKARARRAEKTRAKYGNYPGMRPEYLEILANSNELDDEQQVRLFLLVCEGSGVPLRVTMGGTLKPPRYYVAALFNDGIKFRFQESTMGVAPKSQWAEPTCLYGGCIQ